MKEKKVLVSLRVPERYLALLESLPNSWRLRDRSKAIIYCLWIILDHFREGRITMYENTPYPVQEKAWEAFWSVIQNTAVECNTSTSHDSSHRS